MTYNDAVNQYHTSLTLNKGIADHYHFPHDRYLLDNFNIYTGDNLTDAAQQMGRFGEKRLIRGYDPETSHFAKINRARLNHSQFAMVYGTEPSELSFLRPVNHHNLVIPLKGKRTYRSHSQEQLFKPGQALIISYDQKYQLLRDRDHVTLVCSLSRSGYELFAHKNTNVSLFLVGSFIRLLNMRDEKYQTAVNILTALISELDKNTQATVMDHEVVELLEQSFWTALINDLPEFKTNENLTVAGRAIPGYLRKTIHFINENCSEDLNLNDLASVAGKSVRSLQSGFQKTYGYGPTAYLRKVKLLRVREHILQRPGEDLQVIAARFGFYHAGNFARYYRQEFGELPSETSKSSIKIN